MAGACGMWGYGYMWVQGACSASAARRLIWTLMLLLANREVPLTRYGNDNSHDHDDRDIQAPGLAAGRRSHRARGRLSGRN